MECNKDEGVRAKEIAERKFSERDIMGAKKFAMKAESLYPGLDGIRQLVATLDVYVCAEKKIGGETDWYGILGVDPEADDETVKKQYRKLALSLHPDKNKSVGADGAFYLLKSAWDLLSDKVERVAYDKKINVHTGTKRPAPSTSTRAAVPSKPAKASGEDKRASKRGRKCPVDKEEMARIIENFARGLNDDERKKRFDARRKKDSDASGKRDDDIR